MLVNCTSHKPNIIGNIILWFIKCIESGRHSRLRCQRPLDSIYIIGVFKFHLNKFIHTKDGEMRCEIHTEKQLVKGSFNHVVYQTSQIWIIIIVLV